MYVCTHEQSFSYPRGKELFSGGLEILLKASDGNKQRNLLTHSLGPVFCIMARKKFTRVEGSHRRLHELPWMSQLLMYISLQNVAKSSHCKLE